MHTYTYKISIRQQNTLKPLSENNLIRAEILPYILTSQRKPSVEERNFHVRGLRLVLQLVLVLQEACDPAASSNVLRGLTLEVVGLGFKL